MNTFVPPYRWLSVLVLVALFVSPSLLQGCDTLTGPEENEPGSFDRQAVTTTASKLRHPGLIESAIRTTGFAGKSESEEANLFLAFNQYEADGVTPRILSKYEVVNRILEEYGITRRVLSKYGITNTVLDQYGITRRILNQYGITKRVLDKYGITPRVLSQYDDEITIALLAEHGIDEATLAEEGLAMSDIEDFNNLSALLNEYGLTIEEFIQQLEAFIQTIRVKVFIDGVHLGLAISLDSELLTDFLEEIGDDPDVLFVEPDMAFDLSDLGTVGDGLHSTQITPWGITQIATPIPDEKNQKRENYNYQNPVHVYVLDSGIPDNPAWDDLQVVEKKDFTMLFESPDLLYWDEDSMPDISGFDPENTGNPFDESGHGSHIAGTIGATNDDIGIVGVAPSVRIHSLKVLTKEGQTDITTLLAAVDYVTRAKLNNPQSSFVVNLSLGVDIGTTAYNVLDEAIENSIRAGVIYVAAAGNNGQDVSTYSPAHVNEVIAVGSYNNKSEFSLFSNYGPVVDILAPGEDIISLPHLKDEAKSFESILASGTSFAAPHVTGAIARYLGNNPNASALEVDAALKAAANANIVGVPNNTTPRALNLETLLETSTNPDSDQDTSNKWTKDADGNWVRID